MLKRNGFLKAILLFLGLVLTLSAPVSFAASKAKPVLNIQRWQTRNGAEVYFVHEPQLPILDVVVTFDAGSAHDGNAFGLSALTSNLIFTATDSLSEDALSNDLESLGVQYASDAGRDMATVSLRTLTKASVLQPALKIFSEVVGHSKFTEKAFSRIKKQQLEAIKAQYQSPTKIASIALYKNLYGNHPYAHSVLGTMKTVKLLTLQEVNDFYHQYYSAKNAMIVIVGDVTKAQAEKIGNEVLQYSPQGQHAAKIPKVKALAENINKHISYPSDQTVIRLASIGISRANKDYLPLVVGNYVLGGGMTSRLFEQVRNKRGLSYAVFSYFSPMLRRGPFTVMLQTRTASVAEALQVSKETLEKFINDGPTNAELATAKKFLIGSFPLRLSSNSAITSILVSMAFYHLPLNYLDTYRAKVQALTSQGIKQAFAEYVKNNHLVTVVVGKQKQA